MKSKIYLILFSIVLFSCSSESDDQNSDDNSGNNLLVSEVTSTDWENPDYVYTDQFIYDENKITSITSDYSYQNNSPQNSQVLEFTYTTNQISRVDEYYGSNNSGQYNFSYDAQGRLSGWNYCYYDSNNNCNSEDSASISYASNTVIENYVSDEGSIYEEEGTLVFQLDNNENITSFVDTYQEIDGNGDSITVTYGGSITYDNANGIYKNIVGMTPRIFTLIVDEFIGNGLNVNNNITSYSINAGGETGSITYAYDYNDDNYPRQITIIDNINSSGENSIVNISYY
jgi:hypothetical protein